MLSPLSEPLSDRPVSRELAEVRSVVRELEAQLAGDHEVDTPAYWRAMSQRLTEQLATTRFAPVDGCYPDDQARLAHRWLIRIAGAYRALAATVPR